MAVPVTHSVVCFVDAVPFQKKRRRLFSPVRSARRPGFLFFLLLSGHLSGVAVLLQLCAFYRNAQRQIHLQNHGCTGTGRHTLSAENQNRLFPVDIKFIFQEGYCRLG